MRQHRDPLRGPAGKVCGAQHGCRLERLHQSEIAFAVDEDERTITALIGGRQRFDGDIGLRGINETGAGQIRDLASRIPA